jgi:hypothetical protein
MCSILRPVFRSCGGIDVQACGALGCGKFSTRTRDGASHRRIYGGAGEDASVEPLIVGKLWSRDDAKVLSAYLRQPITDEDDPIGVDERKRLKGTPSTTLKMDGLAPTPNARQRIAATVSDVLRRVAGGRSECPRRRDA